MNAKLTEYEAYKLKRLLEELKKKKGRGTELITLYIPAGRPIADVMNTLRQEYSTASNIKDRVTRHHVLDALTSVMQRLKLFRQTPKNGLVIFCGYVSRGAPGDEKLEVYVLEPPQKLTVYLYRCDSRFHTEILEDMVKEKDSYGFIVIDRNQAAFAILKGRSLEILKEITSGIPGKHRAGGQSARRFERIIEQLAHEFYKRVGEYANKYFLEEENLKGIIIGGPGPTKNEFFEGDYLHYELKKKVLAVLDIGYSGEEGVYELVRKSSSILSNVKYFREKEIVQKFMDHIVRDTGYATYGYDEILSLLETGVIDTLLVSEKLEKDIVLGECPKCKIKVRKIIDAKKEVQLRCPQCGEEIPATERLYLIDYLVEEAKKYGTKVELISIKTEEGEALLKTFGGLAAILRFKIK